jgi:hypothetical protein
MGPYFICISLYRLSPHVIWVLLCLLAPPHRDGAWPSPDVRDNNQEGATPSDLKVVSYLAL